MMGDMARVFDEKKFFMVSLFVLLSYFLPYIILGKDASLLIHDNLDSNVTWAKILLDSGKVFSSPDTPIKQVFDGIPRSSLYGIHDLSLIWFELFGTYWGYVFNKFLIALVGFVGMYCLLKRHFLPSDTPEMIPAGVSLIFALLPFWSFTMSVSGLPAVSYAFLNLRNKDTHFGNWLIILLFPFCSYLVYSGFFLIILLILMLIHDTIRSKTINYHFVGGLIVLSSMYVLSHYYLFFSFVYGSGYVSHRIEFKDMGVPLSGVIIRIIKIFARGQHNAHSLHTFILIPILFAGYSNMKSRIINKRFAVILLFIILTSVFYGFSYWNAIAPVKNRFMILMPMQLQRFHFLHPMFWYVLLGISLSWISERFGYGLRIACAILIFQLIYVATFHELWQNRHNPSYRQFFAEEQFREIEAYIGKPKSSYRVVNIGIHPAIAEFNGFHTLDGYSANYPLSYKHTFRKIIAKELEKDMDLKNYFDNWGCRCYAFSAELWQSNRSKTKLSGFAALKNMISRSVGHTDEISVELWQPNRINHLDFDFDVLKNMGGGYMISIAEIDTNINNRIRLLRLFEHSASCWRIFLYEVR